MITIEPTPDTSPAGDDPEPTAGPDFPSEEAPPAGRRFSWAPLLVWSMVTVVLLTALAVVAVQLGQARQQNTELAAEVERHRQEARAESVKATRAEAAEAAAETDLADALERAEVAEEQARIANTKLQEALAKIPPPPPAVDQASARALTTAESYLDFAPLGPDAMRRQLEYEGFAAEQIEYAISQLY